jgi:N-acetylglutamate synthase-like GNAT family acetyltransferase
MAVTHRKYKDLDDYKKICEFLGNSYEEYGSRFDDNLTLFEFQCALARGLRKEAKSIDDVLNHVVLWFDDEQVVGLLEEDAFCFAKDYRFLFDEAIKVGEERQAKKVMEWEVYEGDDDYENFLRNRGYTKSEDYWVRREFDLTTSLVPNQDLPERFYVASVPNLKNHEEVCKAYKLCYGIKFNQNILRNFTETLTYKKELDLVAIGPDNHVAALCSGRYDQTNQLVTIEAVSCYHDFRKRGISKALLTRQLIAAKELGASTATVFTAMPEKHPTPNKLYESAGFRLVGKKYVWKKV